MNVIKLPTAGNGAKFDDQSLFEQNQIRAMRGQKQLHKCCVCGICAEWGDGWVWFGSLRDADEGAIKKFCSPDCRQQSNTQVQP
jgi:hypothetical protein